MLVYEIHGLRGETSAGGESRANERQSPDAPRHPQRPVALLHRQADFLGYRARPAALSLSAVPPAARRAIFSDDRDSDVRPLRSPDYRRFAKADKLIPSGAVGPADACLTH